MVVDVEEESVWLHFAHMSAYTKGGVHLSLGRGACVACLVDLDESVIAV